MDNKEERIIKYPDTRTLVVMINEKLVEIPVGLGAITIGQMIDYMEQYGDGVDRQLAAINELNDADEKEIALTAWQQDKMFKEMAFFTDIPLDVLRNSGQDDTIRSIYQATLAGLIENE